MDEARLTYCLLNPSWLMRCSLAGALILLLTLPAAGLAQPAEPETGDTPAADAAENEDDSLLDRQKYVVESSVNRAAQWVDSFFSDPNYEAESAQTLLRVRPELYYRDKQGLEARMKARVKFRLPNIDRKTSLVIGSDDAIDEFGDTTDDTAEDPVIGLQFFGKKREHWKTSLSLGVKFNEFAGYIGPRFRYLAPWGDNRSVSFTQTIRYQTNAYWNTISRLDLNFVVADRMFFRQTFDGRWRGEKSDEEGFRTRISSILTQRLKNGAGLQYDFSTFIHTRPETQVDSYVLSMRYRQRTSRDWLYYEIVPQVSFEEEFDYAFNPGIRLRLEFFYGADSAARFWKREHEDTDDFRW